MITNKKKSDDHCTIVPAAKKLSNLWKNPEAVPSSRTRCTLIKSGAFLNTFIRFNSIETSMKSNKGISGTFLKS